MPHAPSTARPVVRCFSREDEGFVDEWPVTIGLDGIPALVPAASGDPALREIHPIDRATAERLVGAALPEFEEPVDFYVEPAEIVKE